VGENGDEVAGPIGRTVRYMTQAGVDQFLDLGSGLPTVQNTHQIAQAVNPAARVVYVDNDPIVLTHFSCSSAEARALEQVLLRTLGRGQLRSREQITRFFDGLDIIEPGIVYLPEWHPDEPVPEPLDISGLLYVGGLGRKL
jgi:hypothetical protein